MASMGRIGTGYPGVYYVIGEAISGNRKEKIFYIRYHKNSKAVDESVGRQYRDNMTAAKANQERTRRIEGDNLPNRQRRAIQKAKKEVWTIERIWDEYKQVRSPKSIESDNNRFLNYIKPECGNKELKDIDPLSLDRLKSKLLKIRKPQTVAHVLEIFRRLSNFAVKKRICSGLNFKVSLPQFNNEKTEDLSPEQLRKLLKVIDEDDHPQCGKMLLLALYLGLRRQEIFSLKWDRIDFRNGFVYLEEAKGGQNEKVPLNDSARAIFEQMPKTDSPYIFPSRDGDKWIDIKKHANFIREKAQLPKSFRIFHGLRHVFASGLASSGRVDLYTLQKLLRHRSPEMVQRYSHLRDEGLRAASNLAGQIIEAAKKGEEEKQETKVIPLR